MSTSGSSRAESLESDVLAYFSRARQVKVFETTTLERCVELLKRNTHDIEQTLGVKIEVPEKRAKVTPRGYKELNEDGAWLGASVGLGPFGGFSAGLSWWDANDSNRTVATAFCSMELNHDEQFEWLWPEAEKAFGTLSGVTTDSDSNKAEVHLWREIGADNAQAWEDLVQMGITDWVNLWRTLDLGKLRTLKTT